jgi:hypothetical protein
LRFSFGKTTANCSLSWTVLEKLTSVQRMSSGLMKPQTPRGQHSFSMWSLSYIDMLLPSSRKCCITGVIVTCTCYGFYMCDSIILSLFIYRTRLDNKTTLSFLLAIHYCLIYVHFTTTNMRYRLATFIIGIRQIRISRIILIK